MFSGDRAKLQTDFSVGSGNALQACIATILDIELNETPNFIADPAGYMASLHTFLHSRGYTFLKLATPGNKLPVAGSWGALCVAAGGSPRGEHKHVVVAQVDCEDGRTLRCIHDPHPDGRGITEHQESWAGFIVPLDVSMMGPVAAAVAESN